MTRRSGSCTGSAQPLLRIAPGKVFCNIVGGVSSAVECLNSVIRMHQARHRTVPQGLLDLKRLYWNCREFRGGKRRGRCPYEHLGLNLPSYHFWSVLQMPVDEAA